MTKRHCFVAQVGDAIEALASALDPERNPPFNGDILDLLEWAEKDVLKMRQQLSAKSEMTKCRNCNYYKRDLNWQGICAIDLPVWLRSAAPQITSRRVGSNDGCDLGKKKTDDQA